jgi:hypothetical protein
MADSEKSLSVESDGEVPGFCLDYDVYAKVSTAAQLRDIKLLESAYSIKPEVFEVTEDLENMNHGFSGECTQLFFDEEAGLALGHYRWSAEVKSGRKKVLKLQADYLVAYTGLTDCDEGHVRFFFEKVGRFATYPYFRALFSHQSSESGLMLPPLPTLNERVD